MVAMQVRPNVSGTWVQGAPADGEWWAMTLVSRKK